MYMYTHHIYTSGYLAISQICCRAWLNPIGIITVAVSVVMYAIFLPLARRKDNKNVIKVSN